MTDEINSSDREHVEADVHMDRNLAVVPDAIGDQGEGKTTYSRGVLSKLYHGETTFRFIDRRRRWFTLSLSVIILGLLALGVRGLNFGIDFKGGTSWQVPSKSLSVPRTQAILVSQGVPQATVVSLGGNGSRVIEVEADLSNLSQSSRTAKEISISSALAKAGGVSEQAVSLSEVGPTWGGEITNKALEALVAFFLGIALYITLRFEWKMAGSALIAVVHDLAVTVGIYAMVGFQVTPATVIAILTILGYSLYDTIVVFDRIQENTKSWVNTGKMTYADSANLSVNQVLMRSLNTSIVAIFPILSVLIIGAYVLGAATLKDFGLALFVGLTTGAYSSIFIASPLLVIFKERESRYRSLRLRLANSGGVGISLSPKAAAQQRIQGSDGFLGISTSSTRKNTSGKKKLPRSKR